MTGAVLARQRRRMEIERKRKARIKACMFFAAIAIIIISLSSAFIINAQPDSSKQPKKYYKSIEVMPGDTLWSIAQEYQTSDYSDINDYINELMAMNSLHNDTIHAGMNLVVAYCE